MSGALGARAFQPLNYGPSRNVISPIQLSEFFLPISLTSLFSPNELISRPHDTPMVINDFPVIVSTNYLLNLPNPITVVH